MCPGYNAFLGLFGQVVVCILFFNFRDESELLGIGVHTSIKKVHTSIQSTVPGAFVHYFVADSVNENLIDAVFLDAPIKGHPMMDLARHLAKEYAQQSGIPDSGTPSLKDQKRNRKLALKALAEMGLKASR
jgi:hypothetical protein